VKSTLCSSSAQAIEVCLFMYSCYNNSVQLVVLKPIVTNDVLLSACPLGAGKFVPILCLYRSLHHACVTHMWG
jgi:hypothetical protein